MLLLSSPPRGCFQTGEAPAPRESNAEAKCPAGQWFEIITLHLGMEKYDEMCPPHKQVWDFKGVHRLPGILSLSRDAWVLEEMFEALVSKQGQWYQGFPGVLCS